MFKKKEWTRIEVLRADADTLLEIFDGFGTKVEDLNPNGEFTCLRVQAPLPAVRTLMDNLNLKGGQIGPTKEK